MNRELREITTGFKRVWGLIGRSEKISLIVASIIIAIASTLTNLPALILGNLVDTLVAKPKIEFSLAVPFILLIVVIILIREVLTVIRKYLIENVATQTDKKQTVNVISHLLKTDISYLSQSQIGSLNGRIFRSVQGLIRLIKLSFLEFAPALFSAIAAIIIALSRKPLLASVMILVIPTGLYIIIKQISSQKGIRVYLLRGKERIDGSVVETLGGIETVRVLNTSEVESDKVERVAEELRGIEIHHHIFMALFDAAKYLNEGFFYILVISLSILFSAQGVISKGDILVYSILFLSITNPLREIHRILDQAHEASINVNDLYHLLSQPLDQSFIKGEEKRVELSDNLIEVKDLAFAYPGKEPLLREVNLNIKKGEKLGIAGSSGCGKTTLIRLFLRLVHDYRGSIRMFGKDLKSLSREDLSIVAYVPQKTYIFSGTIRENVTYGCKRVTDMEVKSALKAANILPEVIHSLGGLEGKVSENGGNLSGGQRQRLAIARLILHKPDLIILDEATSALDNTNEARIQKSLEEIFRDKTVITIAHRLSTLKNSDRIIVFDKGRVAQQGKYQELSKKEGLFRDFLEQRAKA